MASPPPRTYHKSFFDCGLDTLRADESSGEAHRRPGEDDVRYAHACCACDDFIRVAHVLVGSLFAEGVRIFGG
jgi:hypothetical protein